MKTNSVLNQITKLDRSGMRVNSVSRPIKQSSNVYIFRLSVDGSKARDVRVRVRDVRELLTMERDVRDHLLIASAGLSEALSVFRDKS